MRFKVILLSSILCTPSFARAASGTNGAAFLDIPIGGAPSAMGSAYTALATNAYAPVFNPGGLGFADSKQLAGHHISYLETSHYDFASFVFPTQKSGAWGVSAQYFGTGDMTRRNDAGDLTGDFSSHYGAYTVSYGRAVNEKLALGVSGRWINAAIDDVSANAYAGDAGALLKISNKLQGGLALSNAGSKLKFLNEGDSLPLTVRLGLAGQMPFHLIASAEGAYETSGLASGRFGTQWQVIPLIALRAGYRTDTMKELSALSGFSTGLGLTLWGSEFSYTWLPYDDLGQTHSFALLISFGQPKTSQNILQKQVVELHRPGIGASAMTPDDDNLMQLLLDTSPQSDSLAKSPETQP